MRLASYVPGELIPLPLSGSIPELPHVEKVDNAASAKIAQKQADRRLRRPIPAQSMWDHWMNPLRSKRSPISQSAKRISGS